MDGFRWGDLLYTPAAELFAVRWISGSTAVAAGAGGLIVLTTNGGSSWAAVGAGLTANTLRGIAFSGATVVIVGDGGVVLRSTDSGATWTLLAAPGGTTDLLAVTYGNGRFAACGAGGVVQYSTDGSTGTWTQAVLYNATVTYRGIAWGGASALFVVVGTSAGDPFLYSWTCAAWPPMAPASPWWRGSSRRRDPNS